MHPSISRYLVVPSLNEVGVHDGPITHYGPEDHGGIIAFEGSKAMIQLFWRLTSVSTINFFLSTQIRTLEAALCFR